jgi:hypothetical protein
VILVRLIHTALTVVVRQQISLILPLIIQSFRVGKPIDKIKITSTTLLLTSIN